MKHARRLRRPWPLSVRLAALSFVFAALSFVSERVLGGDESSVRHQLDGLDEASDETKPETFSVFYQAAACHPAYFLPSPPPRQLAESIEWGTSKNDTPYAAGNPKVERTFLLSYPVQRQYVIIDRKTRKPLALYCPIRGAASYTLLKHFNSTKSLRIVNLRHVAMRDRERLLISDNVHRFLFVRHPFARALSIYRLGVQMKRNKELKVYDDRDVVRIEAINAFLAKVRGISYEQQFNDNFKHINLSFRMFLSLYALYLKDNPIEISSEQDEVSDLLFPQVDACQVRYINYSFIGHLESFDNDLVKVNKMLGIRKTILSKYLSSATNKYIREVYNGENSKVKYKSLKLFKRDLNSFGYSASEF